MPPLRCRGSVLSIRTFLPILLALAGCGPRIDNPANAPQLGRWEIESKLVALVANDVWLPREKAPFSIAPDTTEVEQCIEPTLRSRAEIERLLPINTERFCRVDTLEEQDRSLTGTGSCGPKEREGMTLIGTLEFSGEERAESAVAKIRINLNVRSSSGNSVRVRAAFERRWKRLGDCG